MDYKILLILISFVFVLGACERNSGGTTKLSIQFPEMNSSKISAQIAQPTPTPSSGNGSDDWASVTPTGFTGTNPINCFGVYIVVPEDKEESLNKCGRDGAAVSMKSFSVWKGAVPANTPLDLEVSSGPGRIVGVFGFHVTDMSACKDITGTANMDKTKFSKPYFIGESSPQNFTGGNVTVPVSLSFNSDQWFEDCKGPGFPNNSGGGSGGGTNPSPSVDVGTGIDGDLVVTSPMTDVRSIYSSVAGVNRPVPLITTTRIMSSTMVNSANPLELSFTTKASSLSGKFLNGDEVYLYIAASYGNTGCGTNLFSGFRTRGIVSSVGGSTITVQTDDARFSTVSNTALAAYSYGVSRDFCRMTMTRVPHLNKLTFNGGYLTWNAASFGDMNTDADNEAGLIILRVKDRIESLSTGGIDVAGRGFAGGSYSTYKDGQGILGATATTPNGTAIGNAGAGSMSTPYSPGGGGHGGKGGDAYSVGKGGDVAGDEYGCGPSNQDATKKCLLGKIFMGGSGGAGYDANGGAGGGIIVVSANLITVGANELVFTADGSNAFGGSTMGGAGGAGGAILVNVNTLSVSTNGSFRMSSNGGVSSTNSGQGFGQGGSGGGGRNHLNVGTCSIVSGSVLMEALAPHSYIMGHGGAGGYGTNFVSTGATASTCAASVVMNQSNYPVKASPSSTPADTTNGATFTIYGEFPAGIQSAIVQDYMNTTYSCTVTVTSNTSFSCTTVAPAAQYSIVITDSAGRKRKLSSAVTLL